MCRIMSIFVSDFVQCADKKYLLSIKHVAKYLKIKVFVKLFDQFVSLCQNFKNGDRLTLKHYSHFSPPPTLKLFWSQMKGMAK